MEKPTRIGELEVLSVLGEGGMGKVYLARDAGLQREVAVKTLLPSLLNDSLMRERFLREARALARVKSETVVTVHAVGEDNVVGPYVVMERLVGEDVLARLHREQTLPVAEVLEIGISCAQGLADVHAAELLHRDVKPANLFRLTNGRVVLTDFGLAKVLPGTASSIASIAEGAEGAGATGATGAPGSSAGVPDPQLTKPNVVVGTPAYLAPELARGQAASTGSDLYALGATLFHLLTGGPPFTGDTPLDVLSRAVVDIAPRVSGRREDVPTDLDILVASLLEKDPSIRPSSASLVGARLEAIAAALAGVDTSAKATPTLHSTPSSKLSGPREATGAAISDSEEVSGRTATMGSFGGQASASPPGSPGPMVVPPSTGAGGDPTRNVKTASLTVMMTDIAGYTERTGRQSREEAARWLSLHDTLLQPVFRAFGGKIVKTIGDAFLVVFTSPTDAVLCGMAIQDRLWFHNQAADTAGRADDRIDVRVAISAGEVRVRGILGMGGDVFGEAVNLAARLEGKAAAGEVVFSDAVYSTMNHVEVKSTIRGTEQFKGISRPVVVYVVDRVKVSAEAEEAGGAPYGNRPLPARPGLEAVVDVVGRASLREGARAGQALQGAVQSMPARLQAMSPTVRGAVAAVAVLLCGVVLMALLAGSGRRGRIEKGEAAVVQAEIEAIKAEARSVDDRLELGLALYAQDDRAKKARAWELWSALVAEGVTDAEILKAAFVDIEDRQGKDAADVLGAWPADIDAALRAKLSESWWPRHHALNALEARKSATDDDRETVGLQDVTSSDCASRRFGVLLLKRGGHTEAAERAVAKLKNELPSNLCMAFDLKAAEDAIAKRRKKI